MMKRLMMAGLTIDQLRELELKLQALFLFLYLKLGGEMFETPTLQRLLWNITLRRFVYEVA